MQESCIADTIIAGPSLRKDHPCDIKQRTEVENHTPQPNTSACYPGTFDSSCSSPPFVYIQRKTHES